MWSRKIVWYTSIYLCYNERIEFITFELIYFMSFACVLAELSFFSLLLLLIVAVVAAAIVFVIY